MKKHRLSLGFADQVRSVTVTTPDDEPRPWDRDSQLRYVGTPTPRVDGEQRVTGRAMYTFDVALRGMLPPVELLSKSPVRSSQP